MQNRLTEEELIAYESYEISVRQPHVEPDKDEDEWFWNHWEQSEKGWYES